MHRHFLIPRAREREEDHCYVEDNDQFNLARDDCTPKCKCPHCLIAIEDQTRQVARTNGQHYVHIQSACHVLL